MGLVTFANVHKQFSGRHVLRGATLAASPGQIHYILGASGAGKSVLLRLAVGLLQPDAGDITVHGSSVVGLSEPTLMRVREQCQLIFQHSTLFDDQTVWDNVRLPLRKRFNVSAAETALRCEQALERVNMLQYRQHLAHALSPGMQKCVAVARALALAPDILLYDEPTTGLDPLAAQVMDATIAQQARQFAVTSLVVSHDITSMRRNADCISFLHRGQVLFSGNPSAFLASQHQAIREFIDASESMRFS